MIELNTAGDMVSIDGDGLSLEQVVAVACKRVPVTLHVSGKARLLKSRRVVERILGEGRVVYGVTTGFGKFSDVLVFGDDSSALQQSGLSLRLLPDSG